MIIAAEPVQPFSGFFPVGILQKLPSMRALFVFGMVCLGVLVLRFTQPRCIDPSRRLGRLGFRSLERGLLLPNDLDAVCDMAPKLLLFMALGCAVYFGYSQKHSKVRNG